MHGLWDASKTKHIYLLLLFQPEKNLEKKIKYLNAQNRTNLTYCETSVEPVLCSNSWAIGSCQLPSPCVSEFLKGTPHC